MAEALTGTGLELVYVPWDATSLDRQGEPVWQAVQDSYEDGLSDKASSRLAGSPLLTVDGRTIHQAYLVMSCVHVARQVRLPSLVVLLWCSRLSACWCLSCRHTASMLCMCRGLHTDYRSSLSTAVLWVTSLLRSASAQSCSSRRRRWCQLARPGLAWPALAWHSERRSEVLAYGAAKAVQGLEGFCSCTAPAATPRLKLAGLEATC